MDGANRFQQIIHITLPGIAPTFLVLLVMSIANLINNGMDQYYVFQNALNRSSIEVLDLYVYNTSMGGGTFYVGMNKGFYVYPSLNFNLASTGYPANRDLWPCVLGREMPDVIKDWSEHMDGTLTSIDALINKGNIVKTINQAVFSTEPALQMDAILQQKSNQIGSILTEYNWKMVLAADEAEFNALKEEMITKAKGLGYDDIVAFGIQECERMFCARKLMNEELAK